MTKKLFQEDFEGESDNFSLSINSSFAKRYDESKRKQEIGHLEDKYKANLQKKGLKQQDSGSESESDYTDSESDEEEDDDGELLTPAVDAQILKTLSEIRSRSDKVYDPSTNFFDEAEISKMDQEWRKKHANTASSKTSKSSKPAVTIKDYQRERLLSGKGLEAEDEDEEDAEPEPLSHVQEQELLKAEMKRAFKSEGAMDSESGAGDLLTIRVKTEDEIAREEEEYRNFLLENLASSENAKLSMGEWLSYREEQDGVSRRAGKSKKQLTEDDFLIDYVLNKGWVDKQASRVPSYDKVIEEELIEDEEAVEIADEFEMAHNFRYEQEGGTQIETFSRKIDGSIRRDESKRKDQRISSKERKAHAKLQKDEELKRLKNLKMAEIKSKLDKISKTVNVEELVEDFDGDFDAEKHDRLMRKLSAAEQEIEEDEKKPVFSSDSEIDFSSDEETKKPVIKKAKKALKKALESEKALESNESEKARLSKCLDELYNLDYEDLIGDIPCRFKYQQVEPVSYGLSVDDILAADDAQLNTYFSLKKLAPYRPTDRQEHDMKKYATKNRLYQFRKSVKEASHKKQNNKE
jgi:protein KRI1